MVAQQPFLAVEVAVTLKACKVLGTAVTMIRHVVLLKFTEEATTDRRERPWVLDCTISRGDGP